MLAVNVTSSGSVVAGHEVFSVQLPPALQCETYAYRASTMASCISRGTLLGLADSPYSGYSLVDVIQGNPEMFICTGMLHFTLCFAACTHACVCAPHALLACCTCC